MSIVVPSQGRTSINDGPGGLEVSIPSPRSWFVIGFLLFWLCGWTFGGLTAFVQLRSDEMPTAVRLFLSLWLGGWLCGELFALYTIGWQLAGRERIFLAPSELAVSRELFGFGRKKRYALTSASNLRVVSASWAGPLGLGGGSLAVDCGGSTIRFGRGLVETEASRIAELMRGRHDFGEV